MVGIALPAGNFDCFVNGFIYIVGVCIRFYAYFNCGFLGVKAHGFFDHHAEHNVVRVVYALTGDKAVKAGLLRNHAHICGKDYMKKAEICKAVFSALFAYVVFDSSHFYGGPKKVLRIVPRFHNKWNDIGHRRQSADTIAVIAVAEAFFPLVHKT